jgi:hypothetical protein
MLNRLVRSFAPALVLAALPVASFAGVAIGVSINVAPPPLPVYVQPAPPGADYIWTPGYWAWGDDGYYWVPGTWVLAPNPGLLWTPGYWGWGGGAYIWHAGYWGPHIGFYGGVNYGFGYTGVGYAGAFWRGGHVVYNRAVTNVTNIRVTNVYNRTVVVNNVSHVSFNGGHGGIVAHADARQLAAEHEHHFEPTSMQREHVNLAARDRDLRAAVNNGRPHVAATQRPTSFSGRGVTAARAAGGEFHPAVAHDVGHPGAVERNDRPPQAQHGSAMHDSFDHSAPQQHNAPQEHNAPHMAPAEHNAPHMAAQPHMAPAEHNAPHMAAQPHMAPAEHNAPHMAAQPHMAPAERPQTHMAQPGGGHAGGGQPHFEQPHAQPHGQPHEGPQGGGGRPEGHEGHGPQNRFR